MIINSNNIVPEFKKEVFKSVVENNPLANLYYQNYFQPEYRADLTFASAEISFGAKVMADVVAIGSKAPRKGREYVKTVTGEIPKIEIARDLNENDQIKIMQIRNAVKSYPANDRLANQLLQKIYEDPIFCLDGVNSRLEWEAKQLASQGFFETSQANNSGGVAKVKVDFKTKVTPLGKNIFGGTPDFATFDPLEKIRELQTAAIALGRPYNFMTTDRSTFNQIVKFKSIQMFTASFNQAVTQNYQTPSLEQLNSALSAQNLPTFVIWESYFLAEKKDGSREQMNGWVQGNVLLSQTMEFGSTQYTITPEFETNFPDVMTQAINNGFILVKSFGVQDPILISTKATAFAMPVLNNVSKMEILKMTS